MSARPTPVAGDDSTAAAAVCINEFLEDDMLGAVLARLPSEDKDAFGLVCKRWLLVQNSDRRRLCARAGPLMLRRLAARFTRLLELDLSQSVSRSFYPGVTDDDLAVVASGFVFLQFLRLQNCKGITDSGLKAVGEGLHNLRLLDVSYCRKVTDKGLGAVADGCPSLKSLHVSGCKLLTNRFLVSLAKSCCDLEELVLYGCFNITDEGIENLVCGCNRIKILDLNKCIKVGNFGVAKISQFCSSTLKVLKLMDCRRVGDESVYALAQNCNSIETLVIGGCQDVSDESVKSLAKLCGFTLKRLKMDWCPNITDSSVKILFMHCECLEVLDIGCCTEVSDAAFFSLETGRAQLHLRMLKVSGCPKITVAGIHSLAQFCKFLEYLDVTSCPFISRESCIEARLEFPPSCKVKFEGSLLEGDMMCLDFL